MPADPQGYVARFIRERPVGFDEAMESSPVEHLVEFWNWLDDQGLLAHHPMARAKVLMVGSFDGLDNETREVLAISSGPIAILSTDVEGARVLAAATAYPQIEFRMRRVKK